MDPTVFKTKYLTGLNAQQKAAILAVKGPVLLLATPGSGKTTVLITRLGYMVVCCGIDPKSILTMTYTVAATKDMKDRYISFFGETAAEGLQFRTINGVSAKIISNFWYTHPENEAFTLEADEGNLNRVVRTIYQTVNKSYPEDAEIKEIRRLITYCKNMMLSDDEIKKLDTEVENFPVIYRQYQETLRSKKLMDFDDQMTFAYAILRKYPEVLERFQNQYQYLCVDEAQDTSKIQHTIIRLLAAKNENLFMVGDEDQSIYGFRAAYPEALLNFKKDHPNARILLIEENYRSTKEIVKAANGFVAGNRFRYKKTIKATRGSGSPVHIVRAGNRAAQFQYLAETAKKCKSETAILFRNNETALPLIDLLEKSNIAYNCKNVDDLFFSNRVVVDLLDIIRFAYDPKNAELFLRLYYKFDAPISRESALYAVERSKSTGKPILEELVSAPNIRGTVQNTVIRLMTNLPGITKLNAVTALQQIWDDLNYGKYVRAKKLDGGKLFILTMLALGIPSPAAFLDKLNELRNTISSHQNNPKNKVILSTIHSSKGLEYDTVYLADIMDGVLPSIIKAKLESNDEIRQYEEDRRLFYVGMTRAKNELFVFQYGDPSSFVSELEGILTPPAPHGAPAAPAAQQKKGEPVPPKRWNPVDPSELHIGTRIEHKKFGEGTVRSIKVDILTVDFRNNGTRQLFLSPELLNKLIRLV